MQKGDKTLRALVWFEMVVEMQMLVELMDNGI